MKDIYLDCNATTSVLPAAVAAASAAMAHGYGNPSSTHATGLQAKAMMDGVRARARRLLGTGEGRLMFNSGATEGIQTAVLSALCALRERRDAGQRIGSLLLYGATEHKAVPESLAHWNRLLGLNLTLRQLPVDTDGRHDLAVLGELIGDTAMLCTMAANNETGVISDLSAIAQLLEERGAHAYWMVDCVQALGKLQLNLAATRIDYAPFSGHKLYAPKGIGMLYVRAGAPFTPLMMGGGQETGQRSGTENMAGIAALGAVLAALDDGITFRSHGELAQFRARLVASLEAALPGIVFNMPLDAVAADHPEFFRAGPVVERTAGPVRCGRRARQFGQRLFGRESPAQLCARSDAGAGLARQFGDPPVVRPLDRRSDHSCRLRTHRTLRRGAARQLFAAVRAGILVGHARRRHAAERRRPHHLAADGRGQRQLRDH